MKWFFLFFWLSPSSIPLVSTLTITLIKQKNFNMYMHYTAHCTIRTRVQSIKRQHRKSTSEKSGIVTYKDTTQVARNIWVSFIWKRPTTFVKIIFFKCLVNNLFKILVLGFFVFCQRLTSLLLNLNKMTVKGTSDFNYLCPDLPCLALIG